MIADPLETELVHRLGHGQRLGGAEAVAGADDVVQDDDLDAVAPEPAEAGLDTAAHLTGQIAGGGIDAELGREPRAVVGRPPGQPATDHRLRDTVAVHRRGVDPVDTGLPGPIEGGVGGLLGAMDQDTADPAAAEGDGGDLKPGASEAVVFHVIASCYPKDGVEPQPYSGTPARLSASSCASSTASSR